MRRTFLKTILTVFLIVESLMLFSQDQSFIEKREVYDQILFTPVEDRAEFPGGEIALMKFIAENIRYPENARELAIQGRVFVQFVVSREGKVDDVEIMRGVSDEIDAECIRVVSSMPDWKPAEVNGMPVKYTYIIPIYFNLFSDDEDNSDSLVQKEEFIEKRSDYDKSEFLKEEQETLLFKEESDLDFNPVIYPNPAQDYVMLSLSEDHKDDVFLQVYNSLGNTVLQLSIESNECRVDISDLPIGMYIFSITSGNIMKTIKLLKQ